MPNGGVQIECKSKNDVVKLQKKAVLELGEDYTITIPSRRNPKFRVTNLSENQTDVDIIASIKQHKELTKNAEMRVVHIFEVSNNETYGAIIELDPKSFNVLIREKKITVGSDICDVTECLSVLRCYRCCSYYHKSNTCRNKRACLRCGGEHLAKECKGTKTECINCKMVAERRNVNIDWYHPAWSKSCTIFQKNIERERLRTVYAE